jgi:hypothetical protein
LIKLLKSLSAAGHEPQEVHPKCSTSTPRVAAHEDAASTTNAIKNTFFDMIAPLFTSYRPVKAV